MTITIHVSRWSAKSHLFFYFCFVLRSAYTKAITMIKKDVTAGQALTSAGVSEFPLHFWSSPPQEWPSDGTGVRSSLIGLDHHTGGAQLAERALPVDIVQNSQVRARNANGMFLWKIYDFTHLILQLYESPCAGHFERIDLKNRHTNTNRAHIFEFESTTLNILAYNSGIFENFSKMGQ